MKCGGSCRMVPFLNFSQAKAVALGGLQGRGVSGIDCHCHGASEAPLCEVTLTNAMQNICQPLFLVIRFDPQIAELSRPVRLELYPRRSNQPLVVEQPEKQMPVFGRELSLPGQRITRILPADIHFQTLAPAAADGKVSERLPIVLIERSGLELRSEWLSH